MIPMDARLRWTAILSPLGVLLALVIVPDVASGTTWAIILLAGILASGATYALSR